MGKGKEKIEQGSVELWLKMWSENLRRLCSESRNSSRGFNFGVFETRYGINRALFQSSESMRGDSAEKL